MRVGFIGLGIMGRPMAGHLLTAGHEVTVWNRSQPGIDALVEQGAKAGGSPADVAKNSEVVFTMVGDSPDVENVALLWLPHLADIHEPAWEHVGERGT